jgi:hypothetical protein
LLSPFAEASALVYTGVRTLAAILLAAVALRGGTAVRQAVGQGASDAACVLFLLAYLSYDLRDVAKFFAPPLLVYVVLWEARSLAVRLDGEDEPDAGDGAALTAALTWPLRLAYELLMIMPPVVAGGFLVFDLLFPGQWPFPNRPAALRCEPAVIARGDRVTLRMAVPHGGELGVFTPSGRYLYLIGFARGDTPREQRFEHRERVTLSSGATAGRLRPGAPPELVFSDTGTYTFRISEPAEVSASLSCSVRYRGAPH